MAVSIVKTNTTGKLFLAIAIVVLLVAVSPFPCHANDPHLACFEKCLKHCGAPCYHQCIDKCKKRLPSSTFKRGSGD
ncbi:unnamed protein product [Linum trigynum]|uniref:Plant thionin family protein n=1 Tax=Linum trigynum TaxID=586398 RepID=A0AAV2DSN7_9ROSI